MTSDTLQQKLAIYDNKPFLPLWEYEIHRSLEHVIKEQKLSVDDTSLSELLAFAFFENSLNEQSYWKTYFGPLISHTNDNNVSVLRSTYLLIFNLGLDLLYEQRRKKG